MLFALACVAVEASCANIMLSPDIREQLGVWPVHVLANRRTGWSLWFGGDVDKVLGAGGRVLLFPTLSALRAEIGISPSSLEPERVRGLLPSEIDAVLASPGADVDIDGAASWFAGVEGGTDLGECEIVLNGMNFLADIGATAGDEELLDALSKEPLSVILDRLTFLLTFLGRESGQPEDPNEIRRSISAAAADAAAWCVARGTSHIEFR